MAQWTRPDRKHSIEAVKQIITADRSETVAGLAAELGMNNQTVRDIRLGRTYQDVMPEVERTPFWNRQGGCIKCRHYRKGDKNGYLKTVCQLDVPEFRESTKPSNVGLMCSWFQPKPEESEPAGASSFWR